MGVVGKALRGFGKALKKTMDSKKTGDVLEAGVVTSIPAAMVAGEIKHRRKKKKKAEEGLKKLKNIVPHVEYIRSKKKSK